MFHSCPYCSHLKKALKDHNYCSNNATDSIESTKSNSFYLTSNHMHSGNHISRLSIRGVLNGYQYYQTGKKDRVVKKDNYLIINEGQSWFSQIEAESPVEMIVVAFHPEFINKAIYGLTASSEKLLDDPFLSEGNPILYSENTYPNDDRISLLFLKLKEGILAEKGEMFFEQTHFELLQMMFQKHQGRLNQAELLPAKKAFVRKEIFERLGLAKDYMDAHLNQKLELSEIGQIAALSPFHFLRLFKSIYQKTPHQYLTSERMKRGYYLLTNSSKTISEICDDVGFEDHSAFSRAFKSHFRQTPSQVRVSLKK